MMAEPRERLQLVFFGMMGIFSYHPLEALLEAGYQVRAIVTPQLQDRSVNVVLPAVLGRLPAEKNRRPLPQLVPPALQNIRQLAYRMAIPLLEVGSLQDAGSRDLPAIDAYEPDAICVACFPYRLPDRLLRIPRLGSVNVHPSLLPDNRGPDPLFWTFRRGDTFTGVTVHVMDSGFDTGPILLQERMRVPDGISESALEERLAIEGGELLVRSLAGLSTQSIVPTHQDSQQATSFSFPISDDFVITPEHPARWAYNFACGLRSRPIPILIQVEEQRFRLLEALDFDPDGILEPRWQLDGNLLSLACRPGVFRARIAL
jgi:methionyl-tRNA formyltransferase